MTSIPFIKQTELAVFFKKKKSKSKSSLSTYLFLFFQRLVTHTLWALFLLVTGTSNL